MQIISTENIRADLKHHLIYLQLMCSLSTQRYNTVKNPELKKQLIDIYDSIDGMNYNSLLIKGPQVIEKLKSLTDYFLRKYPPKRPIADIASAFNEFFGKGENLFTTGVEFGWLDSVMDLRAKMWPSDLPYHTKIGLGHHAGYANTEDEFLLRDSFYVFLKAEEAYENLLKLRDALDKKADLIESNFDKTLYDRLNLLKFNVSTHSRLTIVSFYSFLESFVNSVGFDFYHRNKTNLTERESEILRGKKRDRYLQLEYKLEKFPTIIRQDRAQVIFIKDRNQAKEPFRTLFRDYKNLRDSSVHYSPLKEKISHSPIDWITKAREFKDLAMKAAQVFWGACYPDRQDPEYLGRLDQKIQLKLAGKRLGIEKDMVMSSQPSAAPDWQETASASR
jgi:hypothetical protein